MSGVTIAKVLLGLLVAYLLGSIPTGFVLGRLLKGIDIREHGSGNTGATNVFRVMGKGAGITALVIDLLKGVLAVLGMSWLLSLVVDGVVLADAWFLMLAALLAVLGHSKSVWLGFSGGKSAATGLGVLLALAWPVGLSVASVFAVAVAVSRMVSVGSIAAALSVGVFMVLMQQPLPYVLLAIAGGFYVVLRHRSNIARLMEGTEPRTFGG
ncbi:MAG: glycerol-3-phosphate 1-O-acyltransferase PlsY [Cyanobacteria bacterium P01_D01_bin.36]